MYQTNTSNLWKEKLKNIFLFQNNRLDEHREPICNTDVTSRVADSYF